MTRRAAPFLERGAYRARRLADAARMMPFVGLVGLVAPVALGGPAGAGTAAVFIWITGVWAVLIAATAALVHWLGRWEAEVERAEAREGGGVERDRVT